MKGDVIPILDNELVESNHFSYSLFDHHIRLCYADRMYLKAAAINFDHPPAIQVLITSKLYLETFDCA